MTDVGLLHNMSVPPRSTVQVSRSVLPGQRFVLDGRWLSATVVQRLLTHGAAAALELVEEGNGNLELPLAGQSSKAFEARAAECFTAALADQGVPRRIGIFVDEDSRSKQVPLLNLAATLAVLSRRSGPLYLPRRRFNPSLITPLKALVLVFPEVP
jgi:hypothetical protein